MAYDDDDDLYDEEFDFVDDEDAEVSKTEETPAPKGAKKRPNSRDKEREKPEKSTGRGGRRKPAVKRQPRRESAEPKAAAGNAPEPAEPLEPAPVGYILGDEALDEDDAAPAREAEVVPPEPAGPPADHVVHIYEYGELKRTIPRKFTDEEAVSFAEEYTRTGKAYGRYAVATPEDEEPSPTFEGAAKR